MRALFLSRRCGAGVFLGAALMVASCAAPPSGPASAPGAGARPAGVTTIDGANIQLAAFQNSAFPYHGLIPNYQETGKTRPFLDVDANGRLGHSSPRGGLLWEDQTYNDRTVLLAAPQTFDPSAPGFIIVFFHGNMATLERDVIARQQIVRQLANSGLNAVLVAPQLAHDAPDSSAGRFWSPGGFAAFLDEAQGKLGDFYPAARGAFRRMPVVIVAYSGGYLPAAYSLTIGGDAGRVRGVVLLDALYGERDKFVSWVEGAGRSAFFVSAYSTSSRDGNMAAEAELQQAGLTAQNGLPPVLAPGVIAFVDAGSIDHNDFVTSAWGGAPCARFFPGFTNAPAPRPLETVAGPAKAFRLPSVDHLGQPDVLAGPLGRAALEQARHIGPDAGGEVLKRHEPPILQAQAVAIEAGLALGENGLDLGSDAVGLLHGSRNVGQDDLGVALDADRDARIAGGGEADRAARKTGRDIELALAGRAGPIHFQRIVAHGTHSGVCDAHPASSACGKVRCFPWFECIVNRQLGLIAIARRRRMEMRRAPSNHLASSRFSPKTSNRTGRRQRRPQTLSEGLGELSNTVYISRKLW